MFSYGQIVFIVKKSRNRLSYKKISPFSPADSQEDLINDFNEQAKREIASRCSIACSEQSDSFQTNLYGGSYTVTLISRFNNAFLFCAAEQTDNRRKKARSKSFGELSSGIFIWRVKKQDFTFGYGNTAYFLQTGLPAKALHKTPEELFSPKKALYVHSKLMECITSKRPISYIHKAAKNTLGISLYPKFKNGQVIRIIGICTDITHQISDLTTPYRKRATLLLQDNMIKEQLRFEEVLSRSVRDFLDSGLAGFHTCIKKMVKEIGILLNVDWAIAYKSNSAICGISSEWFSQPDTGQNNFCRIANSADFSSWASQLRSGRIFVVNDRQKELPSLQNVLESTGNANVQSVIAVPMLRSDEYWGVLCVASLQQKRIWTTQEIAFMKTAAEIIMSAYLRTKMEKQLSESNHVLVEYDECLQEMLCVQETLNASARQFISADPESFAPCVSNMLQSLSEISDADSAFIAVTDGDSHRRYSWHKKGLPSNKMNEFTFSDWSCYLNDAGHIAVDDVYQGLYSLPGFVQNFILSGGIKSLLIVPIRSGGSISAMLFLIKVLGSCHWNNTVIQTARLFSDVFWDAFLKIIQLEQLHKKSKYEAGVAQETLAVAELIKQFAEYAQLLIDTTADNLSSVYNSICKMISCHLPIDSINLTQYSQDYSKTFIIYNWHSSNILQRSANSLNVRHQNIIISIPVFYQDIVWGCLLVNLTTQPQTEGFMPLLELLAQSFVRAYMRIHPTSKDFEAVKLKPVALAPRPLTV